MKLITTINQFINNINSCIKKCELELLSNDIILPKKNAKFLVTDYDLNSESTESAELDKLVNFVELID
jgi:hypothetical protein